MGLYLNLAWRNIWRHRRRTVIVVLAIGLAMMLMMFYDGMVSGFEDAIYGNAIRVLGGNLQIHAAGYHDNLDQAPLIPLADDQSILQAARALPQVQLATRRITTQGLASSREGAFAVSIVGVEPEQEQAASLVAQKVSDGRYLAADDQDMAYIGKGLALVMNIGVGDRFTLVGRTAGKQMRQHTMTVAGIYDVGLPDIEKRNLYISLNEAQYLYDLKDQTTEISISLKQVGQEVAVLAALQPKLGGSEIDTWKTIMPELAAAISTKSGVMNIFSVILLVIAGIGILNLLLMAIYERTREIGLLGAMGMKPRQISALFLLEGAMMGLVGVAFGIALGLLLNILLGQVGIDYSGFSGLTSYTALINGRVYPGLGLEKLAMRVITALVICLLASYYPAREASSREPAEALHSV